MIRLTWHYWHYARPRPPLVPAALDHERLPRASSSRLASSLSPLLSTEQAQTLAQGGERRVRFLDASWYLDKSRDAKKEFAAERLPGAQFFDIEQISDGTSTLPHMLPTRKKLRLKVSPKT